MERETKEIKDFDAKAFVEDCKETLKLIIKMSEYRKATDEERAVEHEQTKR